MLQSELNFNKKTVDIKMNKIFIFCVCAFFIVFHAKQTLNKSIARKHFSGSKHYKLQKPQQKSQI